MLRIATFNVNGIRACHRRGFGDWLGRQAPDVLALQEVRCPVDQLPDHVFGDYHAVYEPGVLSGRNGVAVLTRTPPAGVRSWGTTTVQVSPGGRPEPLDTADTAGDPLARELRHFADHGRYLEVDLADVPLTVASLYLPKGGTTTEDAASLLRYRHKMAFLAGFARQLARARRAAASRGRQFVVTGDFNIAHTRLDLRNWRSNQKSAGFLPEERQWLGALLGPRTLVDVVRRLHPDTEGPYSWWSWRGNSFDSDAGWRIDYQLATGPLAATAVRGGTDRAASYAERLSDHAPVVADYDWPG